MSPGPTNSRAVRPSSPSIPSPTRMFPGATPCFFASPSRRSWLVGSPYFHACAAASRIAATAAGDGPNPFSFAPSRARKGAPRRRSSVSGPTKGTESGSDAGIGARRGSGGVVMVVPLSPCRGP